MVEALIGFGGNQGAVVDSFIAARSALAALPQTRLLASSALYQTAPQGGIEQPDFLNAVVRIETAQSATTLLADLLQIEQQLGRVRAERYGPRRIDLDLLLYGDQQFSEPGLTVPHPRIQERAFVLTPLLELLGDIELAGKRLSQWLERLPEQRVLRLSTPKHWS